MESMEKKSQLFREEFLKDSFDLVEKFLKWFLQDFCDKSLDKFSMQSLKYFLDSLLRWFSEEGYAENLEAIYGRFSKRVPAEILWENLGKVLYTNS